MRTGNVAATALFALSLLWATHAAPAVRHQTYVNARFSYAIEVPAGYKVSAEPENGDGQTMVSPDGRATLLIWGAFITDGTFRSEIAERIGFEEQDGWRVSYKSVKPGAASYSGTKGDHIFYARSIPAAAARRLRIFASNMTNRIVRLSIRLSRLWSRRCMRPWAAIDSGRTGRPLR